MDILLLRLKAPMMSFGDVDSSDELGPTMRHPGLSMIAGMIANAMGHEHGDSDLTQQIQDHIEIASIELTKGIVETDEQAVDLAHGDTGFTTHGAPMTRAGHPYSYRTAMRRWRDYIAGGEIAVALAVTKSITGAHVTLDEIEQALRRPMRPLFIGRKAFLPSAPLVIGRILAPDLLQALATLKEREKPGQQCHYRCGGCGLSRHQKETGTSAVENTVADRRDWTTRTHGGERRVIEGYL